MKNIELISEHIYTKLVSKFLTEEYAYKSKLHGKHLLYHATSANGIVNILSKGYLLGDTMHTVLNKGKGEKYGISFTRNEKFVFIDLPYVLIFDYDAIKRDYGRNLYPIDYFNKDYKTDDFEHRPKSQPEISGGRDYNEKEFEEFLILGDTPDKKMPIAKYLIGLKINFTKEGDDYKEFNKISAHKTLISIIKLYKSFCDKNNKEFFLLDSNFKDISNLNLNTITKKDYDN